MGHMVVEKIQTANLAQRTFHARDKYGVHARVLFQVLMMSVSKKPVLRHKLLLCAALCASSLEFTSGHEQDEELEPAMELCAVHYRKVENKQELIERLIKEENGYNEQEGHDWVEYIKIVLKLDANPSKYIEMMAELDPSGTFITPASASQSTASSENQAKRCSYIGQRTEQGKRARQLLKMEIDKMLEKELIEP